MPNAAFEPDGPHCFVPTETAVGPWDPRLVHGAALAALFAGRLTPSEGTLARLTVEISAPVPLAPLEWSCTAPAGGSRVQRQRAAVSVEGREVASATSVVVRRTDLDLPAEVLDRPSPFPPAEAPVLDEPNREAGERIGWTSFDSTAMATRWSEVEDDSRMHQWIGLLAPIVAGEPPFGTELAVIAADYAQGAIHRLLDFRDWSFRNAELTVHLSRVPVRPWVGVRSDALVQPVGAGFSSSDLFDQQGPFGRSAAVVVVEPRG